jgi:hypothetical protein
MKLKLFILIFIIQYSAATAQRINLPVYFDIDAMQNLYQIDSIKTLFAEQGFSMVKESAVQMINNYESEIFLPLKQNQWYKFVFVGDLSSKSFQQRLYDFGEKKVITINQKIKDAEANIIQFDYIPKFAEFHALRSLQINKTKKNVKGYFLLFRKIK